MAHKIVVVDDETKIADILEKFLLKQGFEVVKITEAKRAIEFLRSGEPFDLFITDMKMPVFTGMDVLKEKQALNNTAPFILLTGSIDAEKRLEEGAFKEVACTPEDICYKPVDLFALLEMIRRKLKQ